MKSEMWPRNGLNRGRGFRPQNWRMPHSQLRQHRFRLRRKSLAYANGVPRAFLVWWKAPISNTSGQEQLRQCGDVPVLGEGVAPLVDGVEEGGEVNPTVLCRVEQEVAAGAIEQR